MSDTFHGLLDRYVPVDWRRSPPLPPRDDEKHVPKLEKLSILSNRQASYRFQPHFHPYVDALISRLIEKSVRGLQAADTDYRRKPDGTFVTGSDGKPTPKLYQDLFSSARYDPVPAPSSPSPSTGAWVDPKYPVNNLDFSAGGAYSGYNWELFFHIPITVGIHLSRNQRFEDAQRWFHHIFDPTFDGDEPAPARFWRFKPFQDDDVKLVESILLNLSTGADPDLRQSTINSIEALKENPFRPHVVARFRQSAFMFKTVMAYLDNLIAWGDSLFRQDTGEAINEAMQLYVLAANILGPRPQPVPKKGSVRTQTYDSLRKDLDAFGNAVRDIETNIPFNITAFPREAADTDKFSTLDSIGKALFFCVPANSNLLSYWDTVADRLFKIRNSLNIQGIFRQLPLFEPPIDPALLVRAAAAGLDIGAVMAGINQPLPLVRFNVLAAKASEICQEVKSLGNALLAAIEKQDNEALAVLRAKHESTLLGLGEMVRYAQLQEATKTREGLEQSRDNLFQRYVYYQRLLGKKESDIQIPDLDPADLASLNKLKFRSSEPVVPLEGIEIEFADGEDSAGGKRISRHEGKELALMQIAQGFQDAAAATDSIGSALALLPKFRGHGQPLGPGVSVEFGGTELHNMFSSISSAIRGVAGRVNFEAGQAGKIGAFARRVQDWTFQSNNTAGEITQLFKQLRAAQIREAMAEREWKNHQQQIKNAKDIEYFLNEEGKQKTGKTSNQALYAWMRREVKGLYAQAFQFAFDVARKAERALQRELATTELNFLQPGYLSGKEGLLAGERLFFDLKRMEIAYHDFNRREYELTQHISLLQVDPAALLALRLTGRCTVTLPEDIFDMSGPGHYFRRIKSVALSIPCVTGPYAGVNCTLTLLKSSIRKSALVEGGYGRKADAEDARFEDHFGSLDAIVTSTGQSDSGLFETNLRDERYLPFEGAGVESQWQLELPAKVRQFDYDTISDVIFHIRYTAREGGGSLRKEAVGSLETKIKNAGAAGSIRLFSIRHEFPNEWAKFKSATVSAAQMVELALTLRDEHYPYWSKSYLKKIRKIDLYAATKEKIIVSDKADGTGQKDESSKDAALGDIAHATLVNVAPPPPTGPFTIYLNQNTIQDLWLAMTWGD